MTLAFRVSAILILFCVLFIATYSVWAKNATEAGTRKERIQQRLEIRKENIAQRLEDRKAAIASREAALKEKLAKFRNKLKAEVAERISNNLNKINEKHTAHMLRFLDNASKILSRLEERVNKGTPDIKDPDKAKQAISDAKAKIASAEAAVKLQAENDYTIQVGSENTIRADAKRIRDKLHQDLMAVRKLVIEAKQAVANAIRVAKSGKVEIPRKEATESGQ